MAKAGADGILASSHARSSMSIFDRSPSWWLLRIFAALGVLYIVERSTTYFLWKANDRPFISSPLAPGGGDLFRGSTNKILVDSVTHLPPSSNSSEHQIAPSKALIVAKTKSEDTAWIEENFTDWDINIYEVDDHSANNTVLEQSGHETVVYLSYIIQHYIDLPEYMVFSHARRYQWHNDDPLYDGIPPLKRLRLSHIKRVGYQNLRCAHFPTCDGGFNPWRPGDNNKKGHDRTWHMLRAFFPDKDPPTRIRAPCCAQFAVHRDAVLAQPVWAYERMRQWLWAEDMGDYALGAMFEHTWHLIFGMQPQACPRAGDCYCQLYGLCNLECNPGSCEGRWWFAGWGRGVPTDKGWPKKGKVNGYPKPGWYKEKYPWNEGGNPEDDPEGKLEKGKFRWHKLPELKKNENP